MKATQFRTLPQPDMWAQAWAAAEQNPDFKTQLWTLAHSQTLSVAHWRALLDYWKGQKIAFNLPELAPEQGAYLQLYFPNLGGHSLAFGLAVAALLAAMGQKTLIATDTGIGERFGLSDLLNSQGAASVFSNPNNLQKRLADTNLALLRLADWLPTWSGWADWRQAGDILEQIQPLIFPDERSENIWVVENWARGRFYQQLGFLSQPNGHLLRDVGGTGWISLCNGWDYCAGGVAGFVPASSQPFGLQSANYHLNAQKITAAEAFEHLQRLLHNRAEKLEKQLLLLNAAWLYMQLNPAWSWDGAIAAAEAALVSGRAWKSVIS